MRHNDSSNSADGSKQRLGSRAQRLFAIAFTMLFAARLLVPTEATAEGDTLWITQLTLMVGLFGALWMFRSGTVLRLGLADAAVALLVAGHVISALSVVVGVGNGRLAINMFWEWVSLGIVYAMARALLTSRERVTEFVLGMIALAVALVGLGFFQHFVFYAQTGSTFARELAEMERLEANPERTLAEESQLQQFQRDWQNAGLPTDASGMQLLRQRLESSSEPFGTFALANSFAGNLLVWLVVLLTFAIAVLSRCARMSADAANRPSASACIAIAAAAVWIGYCLILTKSRTAYVGLVGGLLAAVLVGRAGFRSVLIWIGAFGVAGSIGLAIAAASGGLDTEVLTEAPKSFQYRMQYWMASAKVVGENLLVGAPGNFRRRYLKYKLAESSEEITDPHNFFLDLWANGGIVSVCGILLLFVAVARTIRRATSNASSTAVRFDSGFGEVTAGVTLAFVLVTLHDWFFGLGTELRNVLLLAGFFAAREFLRRTNVPRTFVADGVPQGALVGALAGLLIHLLGAGGIEMPAICQLVLVLAAFVCSVPSGETVVTQRRLVSGLVAATLCAAAIACLLTATKPTTLNGLYIDAGRQDVMNGRNETARRLFVMASEADARSPAAWLQLGSLALERWKTTEAQNDFQTAIDHYQTAVERDPQSHSVHRALGNAWMLRSVRNDDSKAAANAVESLTAAAARYPTDPSTQATLAVAAHTANNAPQSQRAAQRALELDAINHDWGHIDRYLDERVIRDLNHILSTRTAGAGN